jgi:hypothetical protein
LLSVQLGAHVFKELCRAIDSVSLIGLKMEFRGLLLKVEQGRALWLEGRLGERNISDVGRGICLMKH